jgi:predicted ATPase
MVAGILTVTSIEIKNYRLFWDAKLTNIPWMCVLVGANGTGKSTLFDVLSFIGCEH